MTPPARSIHRLPAEAKIAALVGFAVVVVATPARLWPAYLLDAALLAALAAAAKLRPGPLLRRGVLELPVVIFAAVLPLVAAGPRITVAGISVSQAGLAAAGTLLAKATLGVFAALILAATSDGRELLGGLERLRLPAVLVAILSFMLRYAVIMADDLRRLRLARLARGGSRRGELAAVAGGAGLLFVRGYERGERVQRAMIARGYDGRMPALADLAAASPNRPRGLSAAWGLVPPVGAMVAWLAVAVATGLPTGLPWPGPR